jgi:NAD dependent epimerase/dehydratase family enzyme
MADELALASQRIEATRLPAGFSFSYPKIEGALQEACLVWRG